MMGALLLVVGLLWLAGMVARGALRRTPLAMVLAAGMGNWAAQCRMTRRPIRRR